MSDYKPTLSSAILHLQDEGYTEEAELVIELRKAAQAEIDAQHAKYEIAYDNLKAALDRKIVYQTEDEIPVDRAGRKMYNKFGDKLDIEER
jgi:hypothetical protein